MEEKFKTEGEFITKHPGYPRDPRDPGPPTPPGPPGPPNSDCHEECNCACEKGHAVTFGPCEDIKEIVVPDVQLRCEGRFLKVKVELNNACAGRRVNIGVIILEEVGGGFKTKGLRAAELVIPGRPGTCMNNVKIGDFCFVFPEANLCGQRRFKVNVIAHYIPSALLDIC